MRLWHKDLIPVLPRQQLLSQWRECCCIARNLAENGTPNHILVNKILDYPINRDFYSYCKLVMAEMHRRGYRESNTAYNNWKHNMRLCAGKRPLITVKEDIFSDWHTNRYYMQCYFNLQEKYDCGGIPDDEWEKVKEAFGVCIDTE